VIVGNVPPTVFVDATAFVALTVENDDRHADAAAIVDRLQVERWHLYTITAMLTETHALLLRDIGIDKATRFLVDIYASPAVTVGLVDRDDENRAIEILQQYADKDFSFADALAFAVSARVGIRYAWSFDRHFKQYGQLHVMDSWDAW
jgi:predicted nucleic acid-binding protein